MKTVTTATALALALSSMLSLGAAQAEPFNQRGSDWVAQVQASAGAVPRIATPEPGFYNERGVNFVDIVPVGSDRPRAVVRLRPTAFNERGPELHWLRERHHHDGVLVHGRRTHRYDGS